MATTLFGKNELTLVGMNVYKAFEPGKPGRIVEVIRREKYADGRDAQTFLVKVEWLKGEPTLISQSQLNDFDALIADHEKKLKTHTTKRDELTALLKTKYKAESNG